MAEDHRAEIEALLVPVVEAAQKALDIIDALPEDERQQGRVLMPVGFEIDWEAVVEGYETTEIKPWTEVAVGDRVEAFKDSGKVVAVNVPSLFCAHRFEDGSEHAMSRDSEVRVKRDMTPEEKAQWVTERKALTKQMRETHG